MSNKTNKTNKTKKNKTKKNKTKKNKNKYNLEILFDNVLEKSYKLRKKIQLILTVKGFGNP